MSLANAFPYLNAEGYTETSPATRVYNCIAWTAGRTDAWWWPEDRPDFYWPASAPRAVTLEAFYVVFESLGYMRCEGGQLEAGFEKVALHIKDGVPEHAARQLPDGGWTSKLGPYIDITHTLRGVEGLLSLYCRVGEHLIPGDAALAGILWPGTQQLQFRAVPFLPIATGSVKPRRTWTVPRSTAPTCRGPLGRHMLPRNPLPEPISRATSRRRQHCDRAPRPNRRREPFRRPPYKSSSVRTLPPGQRRPIAAALLSRQR